MPKWCVAAGICGVTFTCVSLLRSAYEGSQSAMIVHTAATAWSIIVNQQVNMNKKLTVTTAECGVFSVQKSDTFSACRIKEFQLYNTQNYKIPVWSIILPFLDKI